MRSPNILLLTFVAFLTACSFRPLKGGRALTTPFPSGGLSQSLAQSQNPSLPSRQSQETIRTRTYTLAPTLQQQGPPIENRKSKFENPLVYEREEIRAATELGAAQKDTSRQIAAKLASLRGIIWAGLVMFILGIASLFWPPLKALVASVTTSLAITLAGLALIFLPSVIVGHEILLLAGAVLSAGLWFLAHRHGQLRGQLDVSSRLPNSQ